MHLREAATLAVWSPSSPAPSLFPKRFRRGLDALRAAGFTLHVLPSCERVAGSSTRRPAELASELHGALVDPAIDGIIAAVGGWTLISVLPHLDIDLIERSYKPLIGYSDVTALLNYVSTRAGVVTFHGPMVMSEFGEAGGPWSYTWDHFRQVTGVADWRELDLGPAPAWSDEVLWWDAQDDHPRRPRAGGECARVVRPGTAEGPLLGGSLISLGLLAGTPFWPTRSGSIVFLEAEAIAPDEMYARLLQLSGAGLFDDAVAVVFGKVGSPRATASGYDDFDSIYRSAVPPHLPIAAGFDVGHTEPMVTLPIGGAARLTCRTGVRPEWSLLRP
jgi:muramoyltetrapeptide carboxypeptidase